MVSIDDFNIEDLEFIGFVEALTDFQAATKAAKIFGKGTYFIEESDFDIKAYTVFTDKFEHLGFVRATSKKEALEIAATNFGRSDLLIDKFKTGSSFYGVYKISGAKIPEIPIIPKSTVEQPRPEIIIPTPSTTVETPQAPIVSPAPFKEEKSKYSLVKGDTTRAPLSNEITWTQTNDFQTFNRSTNDLFTKGRKLTRQFAYAPSLDIVIDIVSASIAKNDGLEVILYQFVQK